MNSRIVDTSSSLLSTNRITRMALLLWGLAWFAMSVVIFALGWILPQMRSKPPPIVVRSQSPPIPSEPLSPVVATTDLMCLEKDDIVSTESTPSDLPSRPPVPGPSSPSSSKRSLFTPRWSFSATRKSSRPSSRKSSVGSAGSLTLVDNSSPSPYAPDVEVMGNESVMGVWLDQDVLSSSDAPLSDSPRSARNMRIQSLKLLKNLSRKVSSKQRPATVSIPSASPVVPIVPLADDFCEPVKQARRSQSKERPAPSPLAQSDELRPQQRVDSLSGEVFTSTFVNPFRIKPRKPKPSLAPTNPPPSSAPAPRRASGPRRMLNSLHLTLASNASHTSVGPTPDSPRSSISSASTSTFSASSSIKSAFSGSSGSPRGARRTQPYAAPYYAAMPGSATPGTSARRRAASCSREWRPEPVEEESEDSNANALRLEFASSESEFGQMRRGSTPLREVQTEPHRGWNGAGHRAAASESGVVLGSAR